MAREREEVRLLADQVYLLREIRDLLGHVVALLSPPQSTTAVLSTRSGGNMATEAVLTFTLSDDVTPGPPPKGDGSGIVVTFASDNPAVTLGNATGAGNTATAPITGSAAFNLSALVANVSGAPLLDDDGATPFVQPAPVAVAAAAPPPAQTTTAVLSTQ
jgi:hypothetical protein